MVYGDIRCKAKAVSGWVMSDVLQVNEYTNTIFFFEGGWMCCAVEQRKKGFCEERE
jgi:hypothetical protein